VVTPCLIVPHYRHVAEFEQFLPRLLALALPIILIDDGSSDAQVSQLEQLIQDKPDITLVKHGHNRGKGAAVMTGLTLARAQGYSHGFQVDADGQHNLEDVHHFIEQARAHPNAIICGKPTFTDDAPKARVYGRRVTDFWVALETLSTQIKDGLCGFRVYPLVQTEQICDAYYIGKRMDFDTEILVKAVWRNIELRFIDTQVIYPEGGASHFNYLRDNLLLIRLHTRLMLGMLVRSPWLIAQRLRG
jgi:glycosyltransferase involved in cell wall biosynthesis